MHIQRVRGKYEVSVCVCVGERHRERKRRRGEIARENACIDAGVAVVVIVVM